MPCPPRPLLPLAAAPPARLGAGAREAAEARDHVIVVGSSTVYPFSTAVAENFGRARQVQDAGGRVDRHRRRLQALLQRRRHRDAGRQRRLAADDRRREGDLRAERRRPRSIEIKIGYDGIVIAGSKRAPALRRHARAAVPRGREERRRSAGSWCRTRTSAGATSTRSCRTGRSWCSGRRRTTARATPSSSSSWTRPARSPRRSRRSPKDDEKKTCQTVREDGAWVDVSEDYAVIMRQAAERAERDRRLHLLLPGPEPRQDRGGQGRRRRRLARDDRRGPVPGLAAAVHLRQEARTSA